MGFHLRKSFKCGPFRFNLSNSGVGVSVGVPGARIGVDSKGRTYVGGGKGMFRYRKVLSSNGSNTNCSTTSKETLPATFKMGAITFLPWLMLFTTTPIGIMGAFFYMAPKDFDPFGIILFGGLGFIPIWVLFLSKEAKLEKYSKIAIRAYNKRNYSVALNNFLKANKNIRAKSSKAYSQEKWLNNMIFNCYYASEQFDKAIDFCNSNFFFEERSNRLLECFVALKDYNKIIDLIQKEYSQEEKDERPILYAMLAEAFLELKQPEIALEALLSGPINKRKMDSDMCAFRYALGDVYTALGDTENAQKQYKKIYSYDTSYNDIADKINNCNENL